MSTTDSSDETGRSRLGMYLRAHPNPPVFLISAGVIAAFLLAGVLFTDATNTAASATLDFIATYFGWAIYIVLGLAISYFCFRKGLPLRPAAALYPLIGNRIYGW